MQQDIQIRNNEAQRETRKRDKLERELRQCKGDLENKTGDLKALQSQIDRYKHDITKTEGQLRDQKVNKTFENFWHSFMCFLCWHTWWFSLQVAYERSQKEYDVLETRFKKLQGDFEQQLIACEQLNNENQTKAAELKVKTRF